ncbi:MAG: type II toxin-antitoxin system VapB family antitoxin [Bauldia sp.]|nr:type II toxin-antitoxin system VapB family antitoxin [Bauldia sp.]
MGVNIKNPKTERLIKELAGLAGEGQTEAVTKAVQERIERLRAKKGHGRYEAMMAIADKMAPLLRDMPDIGTYLYDEKTGLPK